MKIGDIVTIGTRRKISVWTGGLKGHKKAKILWIDELEYNQGKVYGIALLDDIKKPEFDPETNYQVIYEDEISHKGE